MYFDVDGVFVYSEVTGVHARERPMEGLWADQGEVHVNATVVGSRSGTRIRATVFSRSGNRIASETSGASSQGMYRVSVRLSQAELWSIQRPYLYTVFVELLDGSEVRDDATVTTGLRDLKFTGDNGMLMNDQRVRLRGYCDHIDFATVGMATPDRVKLFRAQTLRGAGGNARRMAHNAASPVMLDIYDRLGVVVMNENRDFDEESVKDMGAMVKRDRNHASIVMWNICNEGGCKGDEGEKFRNETYFYDGTRPTLGNFLEQDLPLEKYVDMQGFSHRGGHVVADHHRKHLEQPTVASECCSCVSNRDEDTGNGGYMSSFHADCAADETSWTEEKDYMVGTFVWTLMDYYGEAWGWPRVISSFGQYDVAGFPKAQAYFYRAWWLSAVDEGSADRPPIGPANVVRIVERWEHGGEARRTIHVFTSGRTVELLVNGVSQGRQAVDYKSWGEWEVDFEAGSLTAVGYNAVGERIGEHVVRTGARARRVAVYLDAPTEETGTGRALFLDGEDMALLRAEIQDEEGNVLSGASNRVEFRVVSGPGRVFGTHNGDIQNHERGQQPSVPAYHGLARGFIQVTECHTPDCAKTAAIDLESGGRTVVQGPSSSKRSIVVEVVSDGLEGSRLTLPVSADPADNVLNSAASSVHLANLS
eukprot:Sspe_Gene.38643::Locus_18635_Transcript_1_1_Confidence_1.000_Length_3252::g.38643::m.38643/K01190/lacZ; beta-galactosidase